MKTSHLFAAAIAALGLSAGAALAADPIPYPNSGYVNTASYSFTAASDGDLTAYLVGGFYAGNDNKLGVLVNGVAQGGIGLENHGGYVGESYDFGPVHAGDNLTFVLFNGDYVFDWDTYTSSYVYTPTVYSDPSLNAAFDGLDYSGPHQHVYSTTYTSTDPLFDGVPAGTYVAFEDLPFDGTDFNYNDESFVFANTLVQTSGAPEPGAWALMMLGVGGLGGALRRRRAVAFA